MALEASEKSNLRALYKQMDAFLQEEVIYPSKYEGGRKPGLLKRLLKKKSDRKPEEILFKFSSCLSCSNTQLNQFLDKSESFGKTRVEMSQILYERISHNASKHLKLGQETVDIELRKYNGSIIGEKKLDNLIPPYLLSGKDLKKISKLKHGKELLQSHVEKIKLLAEGNAKKPYALPKAMKAYEFCIRIKNRYFGQDKENIPEVASYEQVKQTYYAKLLEDNQKRKKFPKKHLTEFEKKGVEILTQFSIAVHNIDIAEKNLEQAQTAFNEDLQKSYTEQVNAIGAEIWPLLSQHSEGKEYQYPKQEESVLKALEKMQKAGLSVDSMSDSMDPDYGQILEIVRSVASQHVTDRQIYLSEKVEQATKLVQETKAKATLPLEEKAYCEAFISYISGNEAFNKRMGRVIKSGQLVDLTFPEEKKAGYKKAHDLIYKHSYKTKGIKKLKSIKEKFKTLVGRIDKKEQILEEERITLAELGIIERYNRNAEFFNVIETMSPNTESLKGMLSDFKDLAPMEQAFYKHIEADVDKTFKTGDIILDSTKLRHELDGKEELTLYDRVSNYFSKYDHASLGFVDKGFNRSHVTINDIEKTVESGGEALISEHYRIRPDMLIRDEKTKDKLKLVLAQEGSATLDPEGPKLTETQLSEQLSQLFQDHSSLIHYEIQQGQKLAFENPAERQQRAGIADLIPGGHTKRKSNMNWAEKVTGRSQEAGQDLRQALLEDTGGKMICSEYAARVTLLSLVKLDDVLKEKMADKGLELGGKGVMTLPLIKEKLSKVHPERLLKTLPKKAVELVESSLAKSAIKGI